MLNVISECISEMARASENVSERLKNERLILNVFALRSRTTEGPNNHSLNLFCHTKPKSSRKPKNKTTDTNSLDCESPKKFRRESRSMKSKRDNLTKMNLGSHSNKRWQPYVRLERVNLENVNDLNDQIDQPIECETVQTEIVPSVIIKEEIESINNFDEILVRSIDTGNEEQVANDTQLVLNIDQVEPSAISDYAEEIRENVELLTENFEEINSKVLENEIEILTVETLPTVTTEQISSNNFLQNLEIYLTEKSVDPRTLTEIVKFSERFGFVSSEDAVKVLTKIESELEVANKKPYQEIQSFRFYLRCTVNESTINISTIVNSVLQILRSITTECGLSQSTLTLKQTLKPDRVDRFLRRINHNGVAAFYAKNFMHFVQHLLLAYGTLSFKKAKIESLMNVLLSCIIQERKPMKFDSSLTYITRCKTILDQLNDDLNKNRYDSHFILNYLNAYVQLECQKPNWVFWKATMKDFVSSLTIEKFDCSAMMVVYNREWNVILWKSETYDLVYHYVNNYRPKLPNCKTLFIDLNAEPVTDKNIMMLLDHFQQKHLICEEKSVQTDSPEMVSSSTSTRDDLSVSKRNVGIQCSFQILMKVACIPVQNYSFMPNNHLMLVPLNELKGITKTVDVEKDPVVPPSQTVATQTDDEVEISYT
ncbi:hypothetical protein CHUAL_009858 [Chamberlinius hualienensis]